ncbi:MAG: phosphate signaling complex protein PhoU [Candidatus Fournierella pullistercoris]|uniref:Phosphate-specific transport system accessory protein PhoU n=1 Tax=Candidatus Allofournierella pullistercoris TaxID=2838597 RepID=A0A948WUZ2_9FIRM|nr:phosphate signaling complex protein PhoU [Candidatus Fournierella pullistercoris]
MRLNYENELEKLYDSVKQMGLSIEDTIEQTGRALQKLDTEAAKKIIAGDDAIDQMEMDIEKACLNLVITQSPVAGDWRRIASIMRMIADLERIGDHCSDISEYILSMAENQRVEPPAQLEKMFGLMKSMMNSTVSAFVEQDMDKARSVITQDDLQDDYFFQVRQELTRQMQDNASQVPQRVDQLMIAKYLERMSDHCTNLSEWVIYMVSGELET